MDIRRILTLRLFCDNDDRYTKGKVQLSQPKPFGGKEFAENAIQRRNIDVILGFRFEASQFHKNATAEDRGEERPVGESRTLDRVARLFQSFNDLLFRVSDAVIRNIVLHAP